MGLGKKLGQRSGGNESHNLVNCNKAFYFATNAEESQQESNQS